MASLPDILIFSGHRFPPTGTPKPRCAPRRRGFFSAANSDYFYAYRPVIAVSMHLTVCAWRKRQIDLKRERYGPDFAKTWLRFATDLEANVGLLDEWGKPKPKKHQSES
jgi:hypothetical protein